MRRGSWFIGEFWSWIAMFILMLIFALLFKTCSGPALTSISSADVAALDRRADALWLLQTPVLFEGQNVTLAYLISLGSTPHGRDAIVAPVQEALGRRSFRTNRPFTLVVDYPDGKMTLASSPAITLDDVRLPSAGGQSLRVVVGEARSFEERRQVLLDYARKGWLYVDADGRRWAYWPRGLSPLAHDSWSEDGRPCKTMHKDDHRVCVDGSLPQTPAVCFVLNDAFVNGNRPDGAGCTAQTQSTGSGVSDADAKRRSFLSALANADIGGTATAPDGTIWTKWGTQCSGGPQPECEYWSRDTDRICKEGVVVDRLATPQQFGMCKNDAQGFNQGHQYQTAFASQFMTRSELVRI